MTGNPRLAPPSTSNNGCESGVLMVRTSSVIGVVGP